MAKKGVMPPSVKPGKPVLTECPPGWKRCTYADLFNPIERPVKLEDEKKYQLVTVKRSRGGVVRREVLKGSEIKTKSAFELREGDFLISNRQIVHGACGTVPSELAGSIVSGEYTVLGPQNGTSMDYARHFSHSLFFQQSCYHSSIGVDIEKMVFKVDQWLKTPLNFPPAQEQVEIAEILSCWDEGIQKVRQLIVLHETALQAATNALFTSANSKESSKRVKISEICEIGRGRVISQSYIKNNLGSYPVYSSQSKNNGVLGLIDTYDFEGEYVTWTTDGAYAGTVFYREGKFNCTNVCGTLKSKDPAIHMPFLAFALSRVTKQHVMTAGNPKLMNNVVANIEIQLPAIAEQKQISNLLITQQSYLSLIQVLRGRLSEEKQALMQKLLTGKLRVQLDEEPIQLREARA